MTVKQIIMKKEDITYDCNGDIVLWIDVPEELDLFSVCKHEVQDTDISVESSGVDFHVAAPKDMKNYTVCLSLSGSYEASSEGEAFDMAMNDLDKRDGMAISKHEIIEEGVVI